MTYMEENLIKQVRARPILYDLKNKGYRNQTLRKEAWDDIAEQLGKSGEYCKETWNKLRNAYTNALNRRKSRSQQQSSRKMPKWSFEDQMAFLPVSAAYRPLINERYINEISQDQDETQEQNHNEYSIDDDVDDDVEASITKEVEEEQEEEENDIKPSLPSLLQIANETHSTDHSTDEIIAQHFKNSNLKEFVTPQKELKSPQNTRQLENAMNELVKVMKNHSKMLTEQQQQRLPPPKINNNNCNHDEDEMYFLSLARFVKRLKPAERIRVKAEVSQIIFQAELRNLPNDEQNNQPQQKQKQQQQQPQLILQIPATSQNATVPTQAQLVLSGSGILFPKIEID